jgi:hypothetical protein
LELAPAGVRLGPVLLLVGTVEKTSEAVTQASSGQGARPPEMRGKKALRREEAVTEPEQDIEPTRPSPRRSKKGSAGTPQRPTKGKTKAKEEESPPVSRKELLDKALKIIANDLERTKRPANTVTSLVQLLKLDRSFRKEEEQPHEIRVVWQEKKDDTLDESAEKKPET